MRLTFSALLSTALLASPALAHERRPEPLMPPPGVDLPPPPPGYGMPMDPRWERMHGEWMERCGGHHDDGDDEDGPRGPGPAYGCGHPMPYGYPGAYMGYAVPMIMVPVLRSKPCREVVEEVVEEVVPVRRRVIRPRARAVPDKRVPLTGKRVPMTPDKRIAY